jgi:hypothetical protein
MEKIWEEVKKQGFSVVLLVLACYFMFSYFNAENKALRKEYKAEIRFIHEKLEICNEERIEEIKEGIRFKYSMKNISSEAVIPSKKRGVFS